MPLEQGPGQTHTRLMFSLSTSHPHRGEFSKSNLKSAPTVLGPVSSPSGKTGHNQPLAAAEATGRLPGQGARLHLNCDARKQLMHALLYGQRPHSLGLFELEKGLVRAVTNSLWHSFSAREFPKCFHRRGIELHLHNNPCEGG